MSEAAKSSDVAFHAWCKTDPGLRRESNQDSFLVDNEVQVFAVADGMGGHRGGEVASKMAVETLAETLRKAVKNSGFRRTNPRQALSYSYEEASRRIFDKSQGPTDELFGMGTTLVAGVHFGDSIYIANVGDSRAYLFTQNRLWQLTEDHSLVNEQLRAGLMSEAEINKQTAKNVITRSVGFERDVQVDVIERVAREGDSYLLCSDGLHGLVTDARLEEIFQSFSGDELITVLIEEAKKNGGDDNITALVFSAKR